VGNNRQRNMSINLKTGKNLKSCIYDGKRWNL